AAGRSSSTAAGSGSAWPAAPAVPGWPARCRFATGASWCRSHRAGTDVTFEWRMLPGLGWLGGRRSRPAQPTARPAGRPTLGAEGRSIEGRIIAASLTDVGCVRQGNEDSFRIVRPLDDSRNPLLAMVCDGMGGHAAGETASRLAAELIATNYRGDGEPGEALA